MQISELPLYELGKRLGRDGLYFRTGPFIVHLHTELKQIAESMRLLYGDFPLVESGGFADFHVNLTKPHSLRRWYRPQVYFECDRGRPFNPAPLAHAFAVFEWSLNWSIWDYVGHYCAVHAASIERNGYAAILPGEPGAGKSTLTAALVHRGWRLLTDELTLIDPVSRKLTALTRPINLKNESIDIIKRFAPEAIFGPVIHHTAKGMISHMRPPTESVLRAQEGAFPAWVIFPRYRAGGAIQFNSLSKAQAFIWLAEHSVNYTIQGVEGFELMCDVMDASNCYEFQYSDLDQAIEWFDRLASAKLSGNADRIYAGQR